MLDPRIAQRQIELEQRKKQQQKNLQLGQNNTKTATTPTASSAPAAQSGYTNTKTSYGSQKAVTIPAVQNTVNKALGNSQSVSSASKGTVASTLAKAEAMADSVYKSNSGIGNNEYTTVAQRQAQQKSLQEEKARQDYINRMKQQKTAKEYGYTQPQRLGGYNSTAYGGYGTTGDGGSTKTNSNSLGVSAKTTQFQNDLGTLWSKYGWQLMGENKPKATGPNVEMGRTAAQQKEEAFKKKYIEYLTGAASQADDWGLPKTIKDGAQPNQPVTKPKTVGPNAELGKTFASVSVPDEYSSKELVRRWINRLSENKGPGRESVDTVKTAKDKTVYPAYHGPNAETARINYLDSTGQNAVEKIIEEGLPKTDNSITVTKDNVYYQSPQKVERTLAEVQNTVKTNISAQKRELEELQFKKKYIMASDSKEEAAAVDVQIADKKADIDKLQKIDRKLKIGLAFNYQFMENQAEKLSEMRVDDILNSNEEFDYNLPYFSSAAQGVRAVNQSRDKIENVISVLEETIVEKNKMSTGYKISNVNDPKNSFTVKPDFHKGKNGYYEYSLSVSASDFSKLTPEQQNLYKALDDLPVSATAYKTLNNMFDAVKNIDDAKLDRVSNGLFVTGEVLDVVDFLAVVASDYGDDGEIGKDSSKKITGMISSWLGDVGGGIAGAKAGAAIGTAIMPGVGTVAGGAIGAVVGAYILSSAMEDIGTYLGGLDYGTEYDLEQHIVRGR